MGEAGQEVSGGGAMCANGCGFFGSAVTKNLCSKCYREHLTNTAAADAAPVEAAAKTTAAHVMPDQLAGGHQDPDAAAAAATLVVARAPTTGKKNGGGPLEALNQQLEASGRRGLVDCANACGYFGYPDTNNLCMLCYWDFLENAHAAEISAATTSSAAAAPAVEAPAAAPNRCASCRKKLGLLGFACRCGGTFCALHRHAEKHACDFDFKTEGREKIAKNNPLVVASKINKI